MGHRIFGCLSLELVPSQMLELAMLVYFPLREKGGKKMNGEGFVIYQHGKVEFIAAVRLLVLPSF